MDNTAQVETDIMNSSQRVTFLSGATTATVSLELVTDDDQEGSETVTLILHYPLSATASSAQAISTIEDGVSVTLIPVSGEITVSVREAKLEGENVVVTLVRVNGSDGEISLTVISGLMSATDRLATASAGDFSAQTTTVVFADGETQKTVDISTTDAELVEEIEGFTITVSNDQSTVINNSQSTAKILDNDEEAMPTPAPTPIPTSTVAPSSSNTDGAGSFGWLLVMLAGLVFKKTK
ncbi:MAG: hypothetical protein ACI9C4_002406 [Paraglaciecola sp.]